MAKDMATYMKNRRTLRRQQLVEILGNNCSCESIEDLQIDHIDPSTKLFTLSGAGLDKAWFSILDEVAKCQLLCKPCHLEKTIKENQNKIPWNKNLDNFIHGTTRTYQEKKCKCNDCKLAKFLYRQKKLTYTQHLSSLTI